MVLAPRGGCGLPRGHTPGTTLDPHRPPDER